MIGVLRNTTALRIQGVPANKRKRVADEAGAGKTR